MSVGSDMKDFCHRCGKVACRGCGILILSGTLFVVGLAHYMHHAVLPGQGHQPHTEHQMDTRQVREPQKLSVATTSTTVFRAVLPHGRHLSGFYAGPSHLMDAEG
jgi:hypothetical protein